MIYFKRILLFLFIGAGILALSVGAHVTIEFITTFYGVKGLIIFATGFIVVIAVLDVLLDRYLAKKRAERKARFDEELRRFFHEDNDTGPH